VSEFKTEFIGSDNVEPKASIRGVARHTHVRLYGNFWVMEKNAIKSGGGMW